MKCPLCGIRFDPPRTDGGSWNCGDLNKTGCNAVLAVRDGEVVVLARRIRVHGRRDQFQPVPLGEHLGVPLEECIRFAESGETTGGMKTEAALRALASYIRKLERAAGEPAAQFRLCVESNEQLRIQLAACATAAGANTAEKFRAFGLKRGAWGWSPALDDVRAAVAREMELRKQKDGAYEERNRVVAVMARMALMLGFRVGKKRTSIPDWDPEWHGCVFIEFPHGQASWHYHDSVAHLFEGLPEYHFDWDGHQTDQKYSMLERQVAEWDIFGLQSPRKVVR